MKLRNPNYSGINLGKLKSLFTRLRERLSVKGGASPDDAIEKLGVAFKKFFTSLGKPSFTYRPLVKGDDPKPSSYNGMLQEIKDDLDTAFEETRLAGQIVVESFNIAQMQSEELAYRSNEAASKITDLRLLGGQLDQEVIIAGDDFRNLDRVDQGFALQAPPADIRIDEGVVTLNRIESVDLTQEGVKFTISPVTPASATTGPTSDNTRRFYEGNFYNYLGAARPEGGRFHLEEQINPDIEHLLTSDSAVISTNLMIPTFGTIVDERVEGEERAPGLPARHEDILVIDRGASIVEKEDQRQKISDEDPGSFWECEYTVNAARVQAFVDDLTRFGGVRDATPNQVRAQATLIDELQENIDLEIQITIELPEEAPLNWLSVTPMNFGETAWLEITDISTAVDEDSGFTSIEGINNDRFSNTLTDEANEEISNETLVDTLAPTKFSFRGIGVWSFPVTPAKLVRFRIRQKTPVPAPYQITAIQLNRVLQKTVNYSRG